jgi:HTH-type transcriptional regulator / antitoxin HigA
MNDETSDRLYKLEEFLADDTDLTKADVTAQLRAEGVNVEAFTKRIRQAIAISQLKPNQALPKLSAHEIADMLTRILAGEFGQDVREAALAHVEKTPEEPTKAELQSWLADYSLESSGTPKSTDYNAQDYRSYPLREMIKRGWITDSLDSLRIFFDQLPAPARRAVLCRKTENVRSAHKMNSHALTAWATKVVVEASKIERLGAYKKGCVTQEFMRELAQKSRSEHGPSAAREFLRKAGIPLVIEPHLSHTFLDGAAIFYIEERPIIGLTVRYDRLDNFWFTLMHELAHIHLHSSLGRTEFFDDLDKPASNNDPREAEADQIAGEMLIPENIWRSSPASRSRMPQAVESLAAKLNIHPAIVAGRKRHESKTFLLFNNLVGHHTVRSEFPGVKWPA